MKFTQKIELSKCAYPWVWT